MSIEQRIADALVDLEAMLTEGTDPAEALAICATDHRLKREVLELRARNAFGELAAVRAKNLQKAEILSNQHKADTAIDRYLHEDPPDINFSDWFERLVGRRPNEGEMEAFRERFLRFLTRDIRFHLD